MRRAERRILAVVSGVLLYGLAVALGHELGTMGLVPSSLQSALGGASSGLSMLVSATLTALPVFVLAVAWGFLTVRPWRSGRHTLTGWCMGGLVLAWFVLLIYGVITFAMKPPDAAISVSRLLLSPTTPPLYGVQFSIAIIGGVALAGSLAQRIVTTRRRS